MNIPTTQDQAEQLLRRDCEIHAALGKIEAAMNQAINNARGAAKDKKDPLVKERGVIETALKAWFRLARKQIVGSSIRMLFGRIIARPKRAVDFVTGTTEEGAVDALLRIAEEQDSFARFVRVKKELNRAEIHEATDEEKRRIAECGVVFDPGEIISVEPDMEALEKERLA